MLGKQNISNCSECPESGETLLKSLRKNLRTESTDKFTALAETHIFLVDLRGGDSEGKRVKAIERNYMSR